VIKKVAIGIVFLMGGVVFAQQSTHFMIKGPVLNAGGNPYSGTTPVSAGFKLRPDSIGDGVTAMMTSASYRMGGGFVLSFPPPGDVMNLRFNDSVTLSWDPQALAQSYHLYRTGDMGTPTGLLPSLTCGQPDLALATAIDSDLPALNRAFFYLVTAVNCIRVEGPDGLIGSHCP